MKTSKSEHGVFGLVAGKIEPFRLFIATLTRPKQCLFAKVLVSLLALLSKPFAVAPV